MQETLRKALCICLLLHFGLAGAVVKHGIIGISISMYKPFCCNACTDSLSPLFLSCTVILDGIGTTSPACRASNEPWLHTLAYCFEQECKIDHLGNSEIQACWNTLSHANPSAFVDWVPNTTPAIEVAADAVSLNSTSLVNAAQYRNLRLSYEEWEYEEDMHSRFAVTILVIPVAFCSFAGILKMINKHGKNAFLSRSIYLRVSQYFTVPALFGSRHLLPLPYDVGYLPSRPLSLLIFIYASINLIFSLLPIRNPWYYIDATTASQEIATYFSNRVGVLSFANLAIAILFSTRNNPLMLLARFDYTSCVTFHRYATRIATIQAIVHSILFTLIYFWMGGYSRYATEAAKGYDWWGITATVAFALCLAFAALPLRKRQYELFLITHISLAILSLIGCWYHIINRYWKNWGYEVYLYIAFSFWGADRVARLVRLAVFNTPENYSQAYAELLPGNSIIKLTVFPTTIWNFQPGQYSVLYFPSLGKAYESHPFSIAGWSSETHNFPATSPDPISKPRTESEKESSIIKDNTTWSRTTPSIGDGASFAIDTPSRQSITFLIRPSTGKTLEERDHILTRLSASGSSPNHVPISIPVLTEGPYGHMASVDHSDSILCFAGGVGITGILGYVQTFLQERRDDRNGRRGSWMAERMVIAWSAREMSFIRAIQALLPANVETRGLVFKFFCAGESGEGVDGSRIDIGEILLQEAQAVRPGKLAVISCAPAEMADFIRKEVVKTLNNGHVVELLEKAFAW